MISVEDARWITAYFTPELSVRAAWIMATPDTSVAIGLDMTTGISTALRWAAGEDMPDEPNVVILAVCPASRKAELPDFLDAGAVVPVSEEVVVEHVIRSALGEGAERFWRAVEEQLRVFESRTREER